MERLPGIDQREDLVGHKLHRLVVHHAHQVVDGPALDTADPRPPELGTRADHDGVQLGRAVSEPPDGGAGGSDSASDSSKALPQNSYAPKSERGLSDFDVRHRLVLSPVYDLPFGRRGKYLTNGWGARLAGGWQVSSIVQWQTGRPFTIYYGTDNSQTGENADRPNLVSNPNQNAPHSVSQWFNTSAFSAAPLGSFGNEGRNAVEGPGYVNADASIAREFPVGDRFSLHLRADSFNLANHPNFYDPNPGTDTYGSGSFGKLSQAYDQREEQFSLKLIF